MEWKTGVAAVMTLAAAMVWVALADLWWCSFRCTEDSRVPKWFEPCSMSLLFAWMFCSASLLPVLWRWAV